MKKSGSSEKPSKMFQTEINPASVQAAEQRWRLFGHCLRMNEESPARLAMAYYFVNDQKGRRGNYKTIASVLSDDYEAAYGKKIKTVNEYNDMVLLAQNRTEWRDEIKKNVVEAYIDNRQKKKKTKE